jgi:hypothetical protein
MRLSLSRWGKSVSGVRVAKCTRMVSRIVLHDSIAHLRRASVHPGSDDPQLAIRFG